MLRVCDTCLFKSKSHRRNDERNGGCTVALDAPRWKCFSGPQRDMLPSLSNLRRTNFEPKRDSRFAVPFAAPLLQSSAPSFFLLFPIFSLVIVQETTLQRRIPPKIVDSFVSPAMRFARFRIYNHARVAKTCQVTDEKRKDNYFRYRTHFHTPTFVIILFLSSTGSSSPTRTK